MELLIRFIVYGIVGLTIETFFRTIGITISKKKFLLEYPPLVMFPIYGISVFLFEPAHLFFLEKDFPLAIRLAIYVPGLYLIELLTGLLILRLTGRYVWYYGGKWQFAHLINFSYAPFWAVFLFFWEYLHTFMNLLFI
jgi:hypothetical protein